MTKTLALKLLFGILTMVLLFHLLVFTQVIPYELVWAGKISSTEEMYVFETVSILINILLVYTLFVKSKNIKENKTNKLVNIIIWIFVVLFALNTLGNLFAENRIEQVVGTLLTSISSLLCWFIVRKERNLKQVQ